MLSHRDKRLVILHTKCQLASVGSQSAGRQTGAIVHAVAGAATTRRGQTATVPGARDVAAAHDSLRDCARTEGRHSDCEVHVRN